MNAHLIWDFDGTLYDTYSQLTGALMQALDDFRCRGVAPQEVYALLKVSVFHACTVYAERYALTVSELMTRFQKYHRLEGRFRVTTDAPYCLQATHKLGCKHYLYTHRDRRAVDQLIADDLYPLFADCIVRSDGFPDKPAPDAILHLLAKHAIPPAIAVMIGDRAIDIQAGRNAGVATILFDPSGFYPDEQPTWRCNTMREIAALVSEGKLSA